MRTGGVRLAEHGILDHIRPRQRIKEPAGLCCAHERPRFERNADRVAGRDELRVVLERALAAKTRAEWARLLDEAGVPNAAVRTVGEALSAPETTTIRTAPHPSGRDVPQVASPIVLDGERLDPYLAPPPLGWDTERVAGGEP